MAALDLLGRRWALRVLWELRDGSLGFRELQARCDGMSSSVLRTRLVELTTAGLVDQADAYSLTRDGRDLERALRPLTRWAERWADEISRTDPEPSGEGEGGRARPAPARRTRAP